MNRLFVFSLLAAFGGCGFTGEPPFDGVRLADVAPWQDVGPVTVCDGASRLGPLASGAAGVCALPSSAGAACRTDSDCRSRERCVCGACAIAVCDSADECGSELVCTFADRRCDRACESDGDCKSGESCLPGRNICRGGCATSDDCQTGERCQTATGLCVADVCADDSTCSGGRACALQRIPAALAEPSPLVENSALTLYFERADPGGEPAIWRATSTDGFTFFVAPAHALLPGRAPSVVLSGGAYLMMLADASGLSFTRSDDGVTFAAATHVAAGDQPSMIALPDGTLAAYFTDANGDVARATADAAGNFSAASTVLAPAALSDPVLWRNVDRIASPFAEARTDASGAPFVRLWFSAHGLEAAPSQQFGELVPIPPDFAVGEAAALDGTSFVPYPFNPVFTRVLDFLTHPSELDPAVVDFAGEQRLYYRRAAADGTGSTNFAVARNPPQPQ